MKRITFNALRNWLTQLTPPATARACSSSDESDAARLEILRRTQQNRPLLARPQRPARQTPQRYEQRGAISHWFAGRYGQGSDPIASVQVRTYDRNQATNYMNASITNTRLQALSEAAPEYEVDGDLLRQARDRRRYQQASNY